MASIKERLMAKFEKYSPAYAHLICEGALLHSESCGTEAKPEKSAGNDEKSTDSVCEEMMDKISSEAAKNCLEDGEIHDDDDEDEEHCEQRSPDGCNATKFTLSGSDNDTNSSSIVDSRSASPCQPVREFFVACGEERDVGKCGSELPKYEPESNPPPPRPPRTLARVLCRYFRGGNCQKGPMCTFSHDVRRSRHMPMMCRYYAHGMCRAANNCQLMHGEFPCIDYFTMSCEKSQCKFSHEPLNEMSQMLLDRAFEEQQMLKMRQNGNFFEMPRKVLRPEHQGTPWNPIAPTAIGPRFNFSLPASSRFPSAPTGPRNTRWDSSIPASDFAGLNATAITQPLFSQSGSFLGSRIRPFSVSATDESVWISAKKVRYE